MPGLLAQIRQQPLKPWIALLAAVVFSLILMATDGTSESESARERTSQIVGFLAKPLGIVPAIAHLSRENARLRAENAALMIKFSEAQESLQENERLRSLLDFKERSTLNLRAAEGIATNPMPGVNSLLIDVGRNAALRKHMAVINDQGLVGKLVQVAERTSVVQLLLDRNVGAAVRFADCRADGITAWGGRESLLIEGVPASAPIHLGEKIITSGLDGVFPEGIPVGQVIQTELVPESLFLRVEAKPIVDFSVLEDVFVVLVDSSLYQPP